MESNEGLHITDLEEMDGILKCQYCNGHENKFGNFIHQENCVFMTHAIDNTNIYSARAMETLDVHDEELNEIDVERQIEEFRKKLESLESTEVKKKMKPNISIDWLKELR
jgi:hypothetical protein